MTALTGRLTLPNGVVMPTFGLGTYLTRGSTCGQAVAYALESGYRLIDTAAMYGNEGVVGKAIRESEISRDEIFVSSKLLPDDMGYDSTIQAFEESLANLGLEYMDLFLIHWREFLSCCIRLSYCAHCCCSWRGQAKATGYLAGNGADI